MISRIFIFFFGFIVVVFNQSAILTLPSSIKSSRTTVSNPTVATSSTYNVVYSSVFGSVPLIVIGISGMDLVPISSMNFKCDTSTIVASSFNIVITLSGSTTFTKINFYYLAIDKTPFVYSASNFNPFYINQFQYSGAQTSPLQVGTGDRFVENAITRPASSSDFNHNMQCSALLMGFSGSSTSLYYYVQNTCYCQSDATCYVKTIIKKQTLISFIRIRIFAVDTLAIQQRTNVTVDIYNLQFINGVSTNFIPNYSAIQSEAFVGLTILTIPNGNPFSYDMIYSPRNFSIPSTNQFSKFRIILIAQSNCRSGLVPSTGQRICFTNLNVGGCEYSTRQLINLYEATPSFRISNSNKLLIVCYSIYIDIYKHNGSIFVFFQRIFRKGTGFSCHNSTSINLFSSNSDLNIILATFIRGKIFDLYTYNATTQQFDQKYSFNQQYTQSFQRIYISKDLNTFFFQHSNSVSRLLDQYQFNHQKRQYLLVKRQNLVTFIVRILFIQRPGTKVTLVRLRPDGYIYFYQKINQPYFQFINKQKLYEQHQKNSNYLNDIFSPVAQFSKNGEVMVLLLRYYEKQIIIKHFDHLTLTYVYHHSLPYLWSLPAAFQPYITTTRIKLDQDGLTLVIYTIDAASMYFLVYRRQNLSQQFVLSHMQRTFTGITNSFIQITKESILVTDYSGTNKRLYVYYCGGSVVSLQQPADGYLTMLNGSNKNLNFSQIQDTSEYKIAQIEDKVNSSSIVNQNLIYQKDKTNQKVNILLGIIALFSIVLLGIIAYLIFKKSTLTTFPQTQLQNNSHLNEFTESLAQNSFNLNKTQANLQELQKQENKINKNNDSNILMTQQNDKVQIDNKQKNSLQKQFQVQRIKSRKKRDRLNNSVNKSQQFVQFQTLQSINIK